MRRLTSIPVIGFLLACALWLPLAAHAQATRTWVSGVGDDVNPCSRTAPCETLAGAISKTAVAGIIKVCVERFNAALALVPAPRASSAAALAATKRNTLARAHKLVPLAACPTLMLSVLPVERALENGAAKVTFPSVPAFVTWAPNGR